LSHEAGGHENKNNGGADQWASGLNLL
jgi:hypothetical protein